MKEVFYYKLFMRVVILSVFFGVLILVFAEGSGDIIGKMSDLLDENGYEGHGANLGTDVVSAYEQFKGYLGEGTAKVLMNSLTENADLIQLGSSGLPPADLQSLSREANEGQRVQFHQGIMQNQNPGFQSNEQLGGFEYQEDGNKFVDSDGTTLPVEYLKNFDSMREGPDGDGYILESGDTSFHMRSGQTLLSTNDLQNPSVPEAGGPVLKTVTIGNFDGNQELILSAPAETDVVQTPHGSIEGKTTVSFKGADAQYARADIMSGGERVAQFSRDFTTDRYPTLGTLDPGLDSSFTYLGDGSAEISNMYGNFGTDDSPLLFGGKNEIEVYRFSGSGSEAVFSQGTPGQRIFYSKPTAISLSDGTTTQGRNILMDTTGLPADGGAYVHPDSAFSLGVHDGQGFQYLGSSPDPKGVVGNGQNIFDSRGSGILSNNIVTNELSRQQQFSPEGQFGPGSGRCPPGGCPQPGQGGQPGGPGGPQDPQQQMMQAMQAAQGALEKMMQSLQQAKQQEQGGEENRPTHEPTQFAGGETSDMSRCVAGADGVSGCPPGGCAECGNNPFISEVQNTPVFG